MKQVIYDYYGEDVIGFIKISPSVYKCKTKDQFYCLKFVKDKKSETMYHHVCSLHLKCFVPIFYNKNHKILTRYQDQYFYIMPWLDSDQGIVKELKLKYYFECLSYLHNHSFFYYNVNSDFFKQQINDISNIIEERQHYFYELVCNFEKMRYRSPTCWMFLLNYHRIEASLQKARDYLRQYQECTCNNDTIRLSLIYNHFDYRHINMLKQNLISIDHIKFDLCIYDIYNMYQRIPDLLFDMSQLPDEYLRHVHLLKEEKILLTCLQCIVPYIELTRDEVNNIVKMSRLLYYLDSVEYLNRFLTID